MIDVFIHALEKMRKI